MVPAMNAWTISSRPPDPGLCGRIGADPADDSETVLRKRLVVALCVGTLPLTALWERDLPPGRGARAAAIPAFYSVFTPINTAFFVWSRNLGLYRFSQLLMILVLPWLVTLALGGFAQSSMVIVWAALCPLGALLIGDIARTLFWLLGFVTLLLATALLQPYLTLAPVSDTFVTRFFVLNVGCVIAIVFRPAVLLRRAAQLLPGSLREAAAQHPARRFPKR